jgi:hypothetical protein
MSDDGPHSGMRLEGLSGRHIGTVDAVFADYLLVRTASIVPVDLYVPRTEVVIHAGRARVEVGRKEAHTRWHRPLKRAPHDDA